MSWRPAACWRAVSNNEVVYVEDCIAPGGTGADERGLFPLRKNSGGGRGERHDPERDLLHCQKSKEPREEHKRRVALTSEDRGETTSARFSAKWTMEKMAAHQLRQASRARTGTPCVYLYKQGARSQSVELGRVNYQLYRSLTERGIAVHDALINPVPVGAANADIAISMMLLPDELKILRHAVQRALLQ